MKKNPSLIELINDPQVFGQFTGASWKNWIVFLCALFALPMTPEQLEIYRRFTGRTTPPSEPCLEAWLVIGRQGGKSSILALIAVYLACFRDWRPYLGVGRVGLVMVIAQDRRQAREIMSAAAGLIESVPMLAAMVKHQTNETIELTCRIAIEVHTASFRSTRGYICVAALLDEIAYWRNDETSAEPDNEILNAVRPTMATIPGAILLASSSPYAKRGELYDAYRKHFGKDGDPVLVWQATTRDMNPVVQQSSIDRHIAANAAKASAEYMAQFRDDISTFISREIVESCVLRGMFERPPSHQCNYFAFADPSGGSVDSFTCAIAHVDTARDVIMVDAIREFRAPFSPEQVVAEICTLFKTYRIYKCNGDKYAAQWPIEQFRKGGITYEPSPLPRSGLYSAFLPLLNSARVELLDHPRLVSQLCGLERTTGRGADHIDHSQGGMDDVANSVAGVCAINIASSYSSIELYQRINADGPVEDVSGAARAERIQRLYGGKEPTFGPDAPNARPLGNGGYVTKNYWNPTSEAEDRAWDVYGQTYGKKKEGV